MKNIKMRNFLIVPFLLGVISISSAANIDSSDVGIYRSALKTIVDHEKPERFAVWNRTIGGSTMMISRVPKHAPENQFVDAFAGLSTALQKQIQSEQSMSLVPFNTDVSFIDSMALMRYDPQLLVVGFSKITYDKQHNALLYSEVCLAKADADCGGEGFWFVQSHGTWKLKKHAYLWAGVSTAFWTIGNQ